MSTEADPAQLIQSGFRFALSLTHETARAEDLVQDAWLSVIQARAPWTVPYFFRVIRNRFIDDCRRRKRVAFESIESVQTAAGAEMEDGESEGPIALKAGRLEEELAGLRPQERAVLYLWAVEGMSASKIGALLDYPRGTVLSLMHRTRKRLRGKLESVASIDHESKGVAGTSG